MSFPETLNFDFVAINVLSDIGIAVKGWREGQPRDEIVLWVALHKDLEEIGMDAMLVSAGL